MVGSKQNASIAGDVFRAIDLEPVDEGSVETDDVRRKSGPETAQKGYSQMNLKRSLMVGKVSGYIPCPRPERQSPNAFIQEPGVALG
jgi:hypothetical protein